MYIKKFDKQIKYFKYNKFIEYNHTKGLKALKSFEKLGITVNQNHGSIECSTEKIKGKKIDLDFPSVGATENIILAATLAEGTTIINNAAMEPEIVDLVNFLKKMGAKIDGAGTIKITIKSILIKLLKLNSLNNLNNVYNSIIG